MGLEAPSTARPLIPSLMTGSAAWGGPISLQAALVFISSLVSLAFAGHLGKLSLSQAVLALSAYNITGVSLLLGLASGMETLCSQVAPSAALHACYERQAYCNVRAWVAQALGSSYCPQTQRTSAWSAAQAYGAGNYMALGLVLQQALIISTLVFLAILALWTQAGPLLLLAGNPISHIYSRHASVPYVVTSCTASLQALGHSLTPCKCL